MAIIFQKLQTREGVIVSKQKSIDIDISNIDPESIQKSGSIIQKQALDRLIKILKEDLTKKISLKTSIHKSRVHNTIFVNGSRGSGKTQFLLSLKEHCKEKREEKFDRLYFFDPIDPTLLHNSESFLTIIIAKILNKIEQKERIKERDREKFYTILSNLSDAIDGIIKSEYTHKTSLENISQDQTSLKLEEYLHSFFGLIAQILDKKRLVLLIDDVDMAFDKGFEVLEVVRKYLSSPYVIPIITGDLELYETIVENNFTKKIDKSMQPRYMNKNKIVAKDYLIKVLPGHRRVYIKTLYDLAHIQTILFRKGDVNQGYFINYQPNYNLDNVSYEYTEFKSTIKYDLLSETLREEIVKNLFSNPLRGVVQFLHGEYLEEDSIFDLNKIVHIEEKYNLNLNITDWTIYYIDGLEYDSEGKHDKAIESFTMGLELSKQGELYFSRANVYFAKEDWIHARDDYEKTIEHGYKIAESYYKIGESYYKAKEYQDATYKYIKSIEYSCTNCTVYNRLGACYLLVGNDFEKAILNFEKAIECDPADYRAYINKIETAFIRNRPLENDTMPDNIKDNPKVKKVQAMLEFFKNAIFNGNIEEKTLTGQFNSWKQEYKDIEYKEWGFGALEKYINEMTNIKIRGLLQEYLQEFKNNM